MQNIKSQARYPKKKAVDQFMGSTAIKTPDTEPDSTNPSDDASTDSSTSANENGSKNKIDNEIDNEKGSEEVVESEAEIKLREYRELVKEKENKKSFDDMYLQQNVYIDRNLIAAIEELIVERKHKKKDIYNQALRMYLDVIYDKKVQLRSE